MKLYSILFAFFTFTTLMPSVNKEVYVCDSPNGKRYHFREDCSGLQACTHKIEKTTLKEARKSGRKKCGYENR